MESAINYYRIKSVSFADGNTKYFAQVKSKRKIVKFKAFILFLGMSILFLSVVGLIFIDGYRLYNLYFYTFNFFLGKYATENEDIFFSKSSCLEHIQKQIDLDNNLMQKENAKAEGKRLAKLSKKVIKTEIIS